jgi:hypothetical protein
VDPHDYYRNHNEDSPLETATIEEVNSTPVRLPVPGLITDQEVLVPHYSCRIVTDRDQRVYDNVPWLSPYANPATGSGLYVVPKPRTKVLLAFAKKGQPYIVGWLTPVQVDGRYTNKREVMPDGSVAIRGDRGNKIVVMDGGIITVQSTNVCKRTYTPVFDQIRDFCRNYFLTTSGGQLSWQESRDGQRLTTLRIEAFEKAQKGGKSVRVQYGSHTDDDPEPDVPAGKIFSFIVGANTKVYMGPNGRIIVKNEHPQGGDNNDISIDNDGKIQINNLKEFEVNTETGAIKFTAGTGGQTILEMLPDGNVTMKSATMVMIEAPVVHVKADTQAIVEAPDVTLQGDANVNILSQGQVTVMAQGNIIVQAPAGTILLDAAVVQTLRTTLLGGGGLNVARMLDDVLVFTSDGPASGFIISGAANTFAG